MFIVFTVSTIQLLPRKGARYGFDVPIRYLKTKTKTKTLSFDFFSYATLNKFTSFYNVFFSQDEKVVTVFTLINARS